MKVKKTATFRCSHCGTVFGLDEGHSCRFQRKPKKLHAPKPSGTRHAVEGAIEATRNYKNVTWERLAEMVANEAGDVISPTQACMALQAFQRLANRDAEENGDCELFNVFHDLEQA